MLERMSTITKEGAPIPLKSNSRCARPPSGLHLIFVAGYDAQAVVDRWIVGLLTGGPVLYWSLRRDIYEDPRPVAEKVSETFFLLAKLPKRLTAVKKRFLTPFPRQECRADRSCERDAGANLAGVPQSAQLGRPLHG